MSDTTTTGTTLPPDQAQVPTEEENPDPYGDPYDRQWPGWGDHSLKPFVYKWYELTEEVRFVMIINSWLQLNDALDRGDMSQITDDVIVIAAWGANDKDALEAGKKLIGNDKLYEWFVGSGENAVGWPRINGEDTGIISDNSYGGRMNDRLSEVSKKQIDFDKGRMFTGPPWGDWDYEEKGALSLFDAALNGGNKSEGMQRAEQKINFLGDWGPDIAIAFMAGGGAKMGPRFARWLKSTETAVQAGTKSAPILMDLGKGFYSGIGRARVAGFATSAGVLMTNYVIAQAQNDSAATESVTADLTRAVEKGEYDPEMAYALLQAMQQLSGQSLGDVTQEEWYQEQDAKYGGYDYDPTKQTTLGHPLRKWYDPTDGQWKPPLNTGKTVAAERTYAGTRGTYDPTTGTWVRPAVNTNMVNDEQEAQDLGFTGVLDDPETAQRENRVLTAEDIENQLEAHYARMDAARKARGGVIGELPPRLGVVPTVTTPRSGMHPTDAFRNEPYREDRLDTYEPRYYQRDYDELLAGWGVDKISWFQEQAALAGLLDLTEQGFHPGQRDGFTMTAMTQIMALANANGNTWEDQLQEEIRVYQAWLEDNPEDDANPYANFVTPAYLAPDYATLAQTTKQTFEARLGRRASSAELQMYVDHLAALDKDQWEAQTQAARQENAARAREWETGEDQSAGTVQGVDAMARFDELFEDQFAGEIQHRERANLSQRKSSGLFTSLNKIAGSI